MFYKGIALITLSAALYGTYGLLFKLAKPHFDSYTLHLYRNMLVFILVMAGVWATKQPLVSIRRRDIVPTLLWALSSTISMLFLYVAFQHFSIATVYFILYSSMTISGIILGRIIFKEHITVKTAVSIILVSIGIGATFQLKPPTEELTFVLIAGGAGVAASIFSIYHKKLSTCYTESQLLLTSSALSMVLVTPLLLIASPSQTPFTINPAWLVILIFACVQIATTYCLIVGLKLVSVQTAVLIMPSETVFATLLGLVVLNETLTINALVGGILIISGSLVSVIQPTPKAHVNQQSLLTQVTN